MKNSYLKRAIDLIGGQTKLAKCLGVKQAHVWNWLNRDKNIPGEYAIPIENITYGKITRYQLRPDIFGKRPETGEKKDK